MATIRKLPSGRYSVQVRKQGFPQQSKSFLVLKDGERWAKTIESQMENGTFVDSASAEASTFGDVLSRYLKEVTPGKKGKAQEAYRLNLYLRHGLAKRSLASLKASDFAKLRDERLQDVSPATVRRDLILLSHVFSVAQREWSLNIANPIEAIRKPSDSRARTRRLEGDEYSQLLKACQASSSEQLAPLFILATETGMRLGEMLGMKWSDVDLENRLISLHDTKNGFSRVVPLSSKAVETLLHLPCSIKDKRVFYSWGRSDSVKQAWRRVMDRVGVQGLHFHDLRREAVSRLFERGLNQLEVASISGHRTLSMLAVYTKFKPENLLHKLG
jgi:integrase